MSLLGDIRAGYTSSNKEFRNLLYTYSNVLVNLQFKSYRKHLSHYPLDQQGEWSSILKKVYGQKRFEEIKLGSELYGSEILKKLTCEIISVIPSGLYLGIINLAFSFSMISLAFHVFGCVCNLIYQCIVLRVRPSSEVFRELKDTSLMAAGLFIYSVGYSLQMATQLCPAALVDLFVRCPYSSIKHVFFSNSLRDDSRCSEMISIDKVV